MICCRCPLWKYYSGTISLRWWWTCKAVLCVKWKLSGNPGLAWMNNSSLPRQTNCQIFIQNIPSFIESQAPKCFPWSRRRTRKTLSSWYLVIGSTVLPKTIIISPPVRQSQWTASHLGNMGHSALMKPHCCLFKKKIFTPNFSEKHPLLLEWRCWTYALQSQPYRRKEMDLNLQKRTAQTTTLKTPTKSYPVVDWPACPLRFVAHHQYASLLRGQQRWWARLECCGMPFISVRRGWTPVLIGWAGFVIAKAAAPVSETTLIKQGGGGERAGGLHSLTL